MRVLLFGFVNCINFLIADTTESEAATRDFIALKLIYGAEMLIYQRRRNAPEFNAEFRFL
jgi:hypothetical protein